MPTKEPDVAVGEINSFAVAGDFVEAVSCFVNSENFSRLPSENSDVPDCRRFNPHFGFAGATRESVFLAAQVRTTSSKQRLQGGGNHRGPDTGYRLAFDRSGDELRASLRCINFCNRQLENPSEAKQPAKMKGDLL